MNRVFIVLALEPSLPVILALFTLEENGEERGR